jgi:cell division protein FtsB
MGRKNRRGIATLGSNVTALVIKVSAMIFCLVCLATIISTQATIVEKQNELNDLKSREETLIEENGEYERILSEDDTTSYMLSLAVGNMGYSYPDEIRFYDTSRN